MENLNKDCKFQTAVDYLVEYSGVVGAVVADHEGLAVVCSPPGGPNRDLYAALGPQIFKEMDRNIKRLINPGCKFVSLKTEDKWLTVATTLNVYLIVLADRKADDLLNVRIQRALDMVANHIKEKYPVEVYSVPTAVTNSENKMEASHV